jgi:hypothetical protein
MFCVARSSVSGQSCERSYGKGRVNIREVGGHIPGKWSATASIAARKWSHLKANLPQIANGAQYGRHVGCCVLAGAMGILPRELDEGDRIVVDSADDPKP